MSVWLHWATLLTLAASQSPLETSYTPGKEYLYEYETQIVTGIPGGSKIYSGLKLKAQLKFQLKSAPDVLAQLEKIAFLKINDPIECADPTKEKVPDDAFRTITEPEAEKMRVDLQKPIKFKYNNGEVTDFETEADDPEYSVNMKRGLLSVFQLNLDGRKSTQPPHSDPSTPVPYNQYTVMEPSVSGECETFYKVTTSPSPDGMPAFKISKVRNYEVCLERPRLTRSMFSGMTCAQCEQDRSEPLKAATEVRYYLRGTPKQYLIQSAVSESRYFFTMYSDQGGNAATFVNQTLYLANTKSIQRPITLSTTPRKHSRGLKTKLPRDLPQPTSRGPPSPSPPSPSSKQRLSPEEHLRIKTKILKQLDALAVFSSPDVKEEAGPTLIELAKEMMKADFSILEDVYKVIKSRPMPQMSLLRKAYFDFLPALGTYDSVEMLAKLMETKEMGHSEAAVSFNVLAVSAQPEVATAMTMLGQANNGRVILEIKVSSVFIGMPPRDAFVRYTHSNHQPTSDPPPMELNLLRRKDILSDRELKRSGLLSLGAVGHRIIEETKKSIKDIKRKEGLLQKLSTGTRQHTSVQDIHSELQELNKKKRQIESDAATLKQEIMKEILDLLKSPDSDDRMMALKTAGNAGFKEHIPHVRAIIDNKNIPLLERVQAIFSLRKLASEKSNKVLDILLPRYFDRSDREEIRISSYLVSAGANPSRPVLEMIADYLRTEPNPHVGTFVFSHLEQLSNSTHPCLMSWAKNATFALKFSRKFSPSYHYSRFIHLPYYDEYTKIGGALEFGFVTSPDEFIPRAGAAHLNVHILGSSYNIGEIGFNTEGLQKIASKILGPDGLLTRGKSIVDLLKERHPRSTSSQTNPVDDAHRRLNVSPRDTPDPEGHIYFKLFGNELRYYQIDRKTVTDLILRDAIKTGTVEEELSAGKPLTMQSSLMLADSLHVVMTEAGLPLRLRLDGVIMTKMHGKMTLKGTPSLFKSRRPQQNVDEMEMDFDLSPSAVFNVRGEMEMDGEYFKTGAAINFVLQTDTPLSFNIGTDIKKGKLFTKINMEKMRERLLKLESLPYTFIRRDPLSITDYPTLPDKKDIEVTEGAIKLPVSSDFGTNELGYTFSLKGEHVVRNFLQGVPYCPLSGKQQYYMTLSPGYKPQKYAELQLQLMFSREKRPQSSPSPISSPPSSSSQKNQSSGNSGVLSWLSSLLGSNDNSAQLSTNSSNQNQKGPVPDLRTSDSSISKLEKELKLSKSDDSSIDTKSGLVLHLMTVDDNRTSDRKAMILLHFETTIDKSVDKLHFSFYRTPIPRKERNPWKMTAKMDLMYPKMTKDPPDLLKSSYQEEIHRLIKTYIKQDGLDQLIIHLKEELPVKQSKLVTKVQSSPNARSIVREVLKTALERARKSADPGVTQIQKLITEQKRQEIEAKKILRKSQHPIQATDVKNKLKSLIDSANTKSSELKQQLVSPKPPRTDEAIHQILLKRAVLQQQDVHRMLHDVVRRLKVSMTPTETSSIEQKISLNVRSLKDLIDSQSQLPRVPVSQTISLVKSESPEQERLSRQLSQLLQRQDELLRDVSSRKDVDSISSIDQVKVRSVLTKLREAEYEIDELPTSSKIINDAVQKQLLDASLQQEQIIKELQRVRKDSQISTQSEKVKGKVVSSLIRELKMISNSLSKILAQVTHHNLELQVLSKNLSNDEKVVLLKLQRVELLQIISLRKLSSSNDQSISKTANDQDRKSKVRDTMQTAEKATQLLEQTLLLNKDQNPELLIKEIKVSQTQADLMDKLQKAAREVRIELAAKAAKDDPELDKVEKQAVVRKLELISVLQQRLSRLKRSTLSLDEIETLKDVNRDLEDIKRDQRKVQAEVKQIADLKNVKKAPQKVSKAILKLKDVRNMINKLQRQIQSSRLHHKVADVIGDLKDTTGVQRRIIEQLNESLKVIKDRDSRLSLARMLKYQSKSIERIAKQTEQLERVQTSSGTNTSQDPNVTKTTGRRWSSKSNVIRPKMPVKQDSISSQSMSSSKQKTRQHPPDPRVKTQVPSSTKPKSLKVHQPPVKKHANGSLSSQSQYNQIKAMLEIEYGSVGAHPKTILIQMIGQKSLEQLLWERDQISPITRSEVTRRYLDDKEKGEEEIKESYKRLRNEMNLFRNIHFIVKYPMDEMPQYLHGISRHLKDYMKYSLYEHLTSSLPDPAYRKDRAEFIILYKKNDRQVDMVLKTYDETDRFRGVAIPYYAKMYLEGLRTLQSRSPNRVHEALEKVTKKLPGTCEVKRSLVKTLDGKEYRLPEIGSCDVILSMDCSSTKNFVVKTRKNAKLPDKKDVDISAEGRVVKVIPESLSIRVELDGQIQDVQVNKPLVITESQPQGSQGQVLLEVTRVEASKIRVTVPRKGIQVQSDGTKIDVKVSPFYYSHVCGACGNYDGKPDNEYETPERDLHSDPECFILSYVMTNQRCNADSLRTQCRHLPQSSDTGPCSLKKETIKRERTSSSKSEVCFSVEPVKKCETGCKPRDMRRKSVHMHCLPKTDTQLPRLEKDRQTRVLSELKGESVDYTIRVQEPRRCRVL